MALWDRRYGKPTTAPRPEAAGHDEVTFQRLKAKLFDICL